MKVAIVSPYDLERFGGVQHQTLQLRSWLLEAGHDAWLVAPGSGGPEDTIHTGGVLVVPANGAKSPISVDPRIRDEVVAAVAGADVVHIHEPFMPMVSMAALLGETPPKVGTFHADPPQWVQRLYGLASPLLRRWVRRLHVATAVSEVAAAPLARFTEPTIVPNGLDVASYGVDVERHSNRVAFLGRDDPRKGLDVLLEAWPKVRAGMTTAELIVGGTTRDERVPGVVFLGGVDEGEKRELLGSAAVFCAPNTGGESFGISVVEGMAAGCAIVASRLPAFEAVVDRVGRLVAPGDASALATALIEVLSAPRHLERMQKEARERADRFDRAEVLAGYLEVYERAIDAA